MLGFRDGDDERLRRAIKDNNLFLVRRILTRIPDIRNPDPGPLRYTSLAWAAVCVHEDIFNYLLDSGHDDEELSRDSENNTILCLLAAVPAAQPNQHSSAPVRQEPHFVRNALVRMSRAYHARYPFLVDWTNVRGRTPLHIAAMSGNDGIAELLCDQGADLDLTDEDGNSPLHYASSWGHIRIVQTLIERGCKYSVRNNDGYAPSDLAYSNNTMETLQGFAQQQFESNKKVRRQIYAEAAHRGKERGQLLNPSVNELDLAHSTSTLSLSRLRSGSGTSESTTDYEASAGSLSSLGAPRSTQNRPHQSSLSSSTSSRPSNVSASDTASSGLNVHHHHGHGLASGSTTQANTRAPTPQNQAAATSSPTRSKFPFISRPNLSMKNLPPSSSSSTSPVPPPKDPIPSRNITPSRSMQQLSTIASSQQLDTSQAQGRRQQSIDISPVATRMLQKDANAMYNFMSSRNLASSSSASVMNLPVATSSTKDGSGTKEPSTKASHRFMRNLLRPSASAAALRSAASGPAGSAADSTPTLTSKLHSKQGTNGTTLGPISNPMPVSNPNTPTMASHSASASASSFTISATPPTPTPANHAASSRGRSTTWDTPTGSVDDYGRLTQREIDSDTASLSARTSTEPPSPSPYGTPNANGYRYHAPAPASGGGTVSMTPSVSAGSTGSTSGKSSRHANGHHHGHHHGNALGRLVAAPNNLANAMRERSGMMSRSKVDVSSSGREQRTANSTSPTLESTAGPVPGGMFFPKGRV